MNVSIRILDDHDRPNDAGQRLLAALRDDIDAVLNGHEDDTGAPCRIKLLDHDCCSICTKVGAAMIGAIEAI